MSNINNVSRRHFLKKAGASTAAFTIVPRYVLGGANHIAPSERINVALVGVGGQGKYHVSTFLDEPDVNVVSVCDAFKVCSYDRWYYGGYGGREPAKRKVEEFYNAKKPKGTYSSCPSYADFRIMFEKEKDIDAVVVATPDHVHAVVSMMAIKMGKHVYCEKPMAHTVYEVRQLAEAARQAKVATQMGNQGHSEEGVRLICEWIADGAIGAVREVHITTDVPGAPSGWADGHGWPQGIDRPKDTPKVPSGLDWDLWLGPAPYRPYHPAYLPVTWRGWIDFGTGGLGDWGCHLMDPPFWALQLGLPESIEATTTEMNSETYPLASIIYFDFPARGDMPPVRLTWHDGGMRAPRPEDLEPDRRVGPVVFIGDKGKIMCGGYGNNPRIIPETKMKAYKLPPKTIPRVNGSHERNWLDTCKGGEPAVSNFDYASKLTEVVLLGNVAIRAGEKIDWDAEKMKVSNIPDANRFVHREYRDGWTL